MPLHYSHSYKEEIADLIMLYDHRICNKIQITNENPHLLINEIINQVSEERILSQIDLIGTNHKMIIQE